MAANPHGDGLLPRALIGSILDAVTDETAGAEPVEIRFHDQHSNDVAEIRFDDDRVLMVKRGRHEWAAARFETSRLAAGLLQQREDVVAPAPLDLPPELDPRPVEAYWRIPYSTLSEVWPAATEENRTRLLHGWGQLIHRLHQVELSGYGALPTAKRHPSLQDFLEKDLQERLLPAVRGVWPAAIQAVERLAETAPALESRLRGRTSTLIHNDLHMDNVLCRQLGEKFECVGVLDLEAAFVGPAEADLAHTEVLHSLLFAQPPRSDWFQDLRRGYGAPLDELLMAFFRAYHLTNLGFYSALIGHAEHAQQVAGAVNREIEALGAAVSVRLGRPATARRHAAPSPSRKRGKHAAFYG